MNKTLISVVVPVYNAAAYLDDCVRSILAQTWQNWELLLVDDGSPDACPALCDHWAAQDPRIRVLHKPNGGVSSARNAGIDAAQGDYLAFVDADDWVEPAYLQVLYEGVQLADVSLCGVDTGVPAPPLVEETVTLETLRRTPSRYTDLHYVNYSVNKLFRVETLRRYHIRMPETMHRSEDVYFVNSYLMHCQTLHAASANLYHYRPNPASATHSFYEGVCRDEGIIMEVQYNFFHPCELSAEEENAYRVWEYGKVLAILRYIIGCASKRRRQKIFVNDFIQIERVKTLLENPPKETGKRGRIMALLVKKSESSFAVLLFKYLWGL